MAQDVEGVGILPVARRQDLDLLAVGERQPEVPDAPVRAHEHRLLGELGPDRARSVEPARPVGKLELRVVGKNHPHGAREYSARFAEQEPEETEEGSPVPDPEDEDAGDAEDVPTAD